MFSLPSRRFWESISTFRTSRRRRECTINSPSVSHQAAQRSTAHFGARTANSKKRTSAIRCISSRMSNVPHRTHLDKRRSVLIKASKNIRHGILRTAQAVPASPIWQRCPRKPAARCLLVVHKVLKVSIETRSDFINFTNFITLRTMSPLVTPKLLLLFGS